ncbi:MAG TPA: hypothetical protein VMM76_12210 [Pirellulaceae bacterium]|nr:hypothetical protein [Pirellulaceae bacterium]
MKNNVIARKGLWIVGLLLMFGISVAAYGFSRAGERVERADCPGKLACPLTGEVVCKDQCPLVDAQQDDCPGKIECPLTGELVCQDECPLGAEGKAAEAGEELPLCCRGKK